MLELARHVRPPDCCLVPEKRQEITTEGGLEVAEPGAADQGSGVDAQGRPAFASRCSSIRIRSRSKRRRRSGAPVVELHTGAYADSTGSQQAAELQRLVAGAKLGASLGLEVHAGHGLNYHNVQPVAAIPEIVELNIGHAIIARAVFDGMTAAVRDMRALMLQARS